MRIIELIDDVDAVERIRNHFEAWDPQPDTGIHRLFLILRGATTWMNPDYGATGVAHAISRRSDKGTCWLKIFGTSIRGR